MKGVDIKTAEEIGIMAEGGQILGVIKEELARAVKPGITVLDIELLADRLIGKSGGKASFKMVPGYKHATCVNVNEEVVHAIPGGRVIVDGDIVGIDVGLFYKGWHTDTAITVGAGKMEKSVNNFLAVGQKALEVSMDKVRAGNRIADISEVMQKTIEGAGYSVVRALTGHGVGRGLHEEPAIPCFVMGRYEDSPLIADGMVLAVEVMYNLGTSDVAYKDHDGWTIVTTDGKISGLFEETVAVGPSGPVILTQPHKR